MQPENQLPPSTAGIEQAILSLAQAFALPNASVWQSWLPTVTGITVGNGSLVARYVQIGKTVHFYMSFTLGSTSSLNVAESTLPVPASSNYIMNAVAGAKLGDLSFSRPGVAVYTGAGRLVNANLVTFAVLGAATTYVNHPTSTTNLIPFTWTTADVLHWSGTYEAA